MKGSDVVPFDSMPHLLTGSFLTNEQAATFKDAFKDFVAVVRCKDCETQKDCELAWQMCDPDWFCADGKRKEGR